VFVWCDSCLSVVLVEAEKKSSEKKSSEKELLYTSDRSLLLACVYFDQTHAGYLLDKDVEDVIHTTGLQLSRAQVPLCLTLYVCILHKYTVLYACLSAHCTQQCSLLSHC